MEHRKSVKAAYILLTVYIVVALILFFTSCNIECTKNKITHYHIEGNDTVFINNKTMNNDSTYTYDTSIIVYSFHGLSPFKTETIIYKHYFIK